MNRWLHAFADYREPRIVAMLFLGFASGLPLALTFSTLTIWLAELGISKSTVGLFASLGTPYALKFLWAPLIDQLPLLGLTRRFGRRRGWILLTQFALIASILALGSWDPAIDIWLTALLAFTVAFCSASQDIVIDAYRVEILDREQYAAGAGAQVFGYRIAMLVSGAGALYVAEFGNWFIAYAVMSGLMLIGVITVLVSREPEDSGESERDARLAEANAYLETRPELGGRKGIAIAWLYVAVVCPFADFLKRSGPMAIVVLGFVVCFKLGDSLAGIMTNPFLIELGFSKIDIANVSKLYGFAATIIGLALGHWLYERVGMVRSLWICGFLQMGSNLMFAVQAEVGADINVLALTIGIENLAGGMGTTVFVAYLSSLCNITYTATQYALLSSLFAVPRTLISSGSGFIAEMMSWTDFFIGTFFAAIPGLILLWLMARPGAVTRPD